MDHKHVGSEQPLHHNPLARTFERDLAPQFESLGVELGRVLAPRLERVSDRLGRDLTPEFARMGAEIGRSIAGSHSRCVS